MCSSALPCSAVVRLAFWNSEHDEIWKWYAGRRTADAVRTDRHECRNSYVDNFYQIFHYNICMKVAFSFANKDPAYIDPFMDFSLMS